MSPWVLAVAAGLGASWVFDATKPFVTVQTSVKGLLFLILDGSVWALVYGLNDHWWRISVVLSSLLISLAVGKTAHAVTSLLQVLKDKNRLAVMLSRRQR